MRTLGTIIGVAALLVTGCAGDDETGSTADGTAAATTAAVVADPETCTSLEWDISPGAFSGGSQLPAQLYGSFGPGEQQKWDQQQGPHDSQGTINEIIGAPDGVQMIRWGEGSSLDGETTVECGTGWGCFDDREDYGWENGIIYDLVDGEDVVFPHIWKLGTDDSGTRTVEIWEVKLTPADDAMAAIEDLGKYVEGDVDSIDWEVFYIAAPDMDGGIPTVDESHFSCEGSSS